jgi:hypothetical protein
MSPTLLSQRLTELESAGVLTSKRSRNGAGSTYLLTDAGKELEPLIETMAVWGHKWARDMNDDDLDPAFLVWSMHMRMDTSTMPKGCTVIEFEFSGAPPDSRRFWLVSRNGNVDMCLLDPGLDVDLMVSAKLRVFVEAWRGLRDLGQEIRAGRIKLDGPKNLCDKFPGWLRLSSLAPYARLRPGRERRLARLSASKQRLASA